MHKKVTWDEIYADFRRRHPTLKMMVIDWKPCGWMCIELELKDGRKMKYDGYEHIAKFIV